MRLWPLPLLALLGGPAAADIMVAARTIPAQTLLGPGDVLASEGDMPGAASALEEVVGMESRVALYAGRPIRLADLGPPAIVERNEVIPLIYNAAGLRIETEGRALDRAGVGEIVRIMNTASRSTVTALIGSDGAAYVASLESQ
ncbi:flagellar basal body P-ring formation chaperone FlgA [Pseudoroseicyclus tamaricis]|uniref:Flagella basal body P-ring formation protein FlgA n=1 Tax=Pseudoroseicyclus tamaricis TaxID=2705421 RepID=A0A6B2JZF9_9RHOB|nr:flagellar basal body P-ring formation chaperone FlgA [Pseudoroseicyclus tamaricis]NDU99505.1 flagellar basal body P-ring formation protein FlgA [Pseudoroseicyclus tamaricis]